MEVGGKGLRGSSWSARMLLQHEELVESSGALSCCPPPPSLPLPFLLRPPIIIIMCSHRLWLVVAVIIAVAAAQTPTPPAVPSEFSCTVDVAFVTSGTSLSFTGGHYYFDAVAKATTMYALSTSCL
jgi:hypothetical protein